MHLQSCDTGQIQSLARAAQQTRAQSNGIIGALQAELEASKAALEALSDALLSEQTLTGMQVEQIVSAHPPTAKPEQLQHQLAPQNGANGSSAGQSLVSAGSAH